MVGFGSTPARLWGLVRPRGIPWILLLPLFGYGFGHWAWGLRLREFDAIIGVFAAWICLHAGTMWLNAGLDRDEGPVLLGQPIPVPPRIERYATTALVLAPALAWGAGTGAFLCAAACALLAVLYSSPHTAWKAHPVLGPAVNVLGYGALSPIAGWSVVGVSPGPRTFAVLAGALVLVAGMTFAAQAFQRAEDAARGYRTLVVTHGEVGALLAARIALLGGFAVFAALIAFGWLPRECLVSLVGMGAADGYLAAWIRDVRADPAAATEARTRALFRRLIATVALLIGAAYAAYGRQLLDGPGPVSGLATAAGFPG